MKFKFQYWCAVNSIKTLSTNSQPMNTEYLACTDPLVDLGGFSRAGRKFRPSARLGFLGGDGNEFDRARIHLVEVIHDDQVRERFEARNCVRRETAALHLDFRLDVAPIVIDNLDSPPLLRADDHAQPRTSRTAG